MTLPTYWSAIFPGVNIEVEVNKADEWLRLHPHRRATERFYFNWLKRTHNRLLEVEVKESSQRAQQRRDAHVGRLENYR